MKRMNALLLGLGILLSSLMGCGGGGGSSSGAPVVGGGASAPGGAAVTPVLSVALSNMTVTGAAPVTVSAKILDGSSSANPVPGVVVHFAIAGGLGTLSASSALTDSAGIASVTLSPSGAIASGADSVVATAAIGTNNLSAQAGFQLTATAVAFSSFTSDVGNSAGSPLSAYGQAVLSLAMTGVSDTAPVTLSFTSACVAAGKATISPSTVTSTTGVVSLSYKDTVGCGATRSTDTVTVSVAGSVLSRQLTLFLNSPAANAISFVNASPQTIYLKGSGYQESSQVSFKVVDGNNNPLPNQQVTMNLTTFAGGLTLNGGAVPIVQTTDGNGQVTATINSGTVPTPVRVTAALSAGISTVSNSLAVAVGLPSELNFSLAQTARNIEGMNIDGTTNTYTVRAADRSGNPVPDGTAISFWSEIGGQISATSQTNLSGGIAIATANFQSSGTRPADGRVTVVAYAIGEESFVDVNGNNRYDAGEPFQDLGDIALDRLYDGVFDLSATPNGGDQYVSLGTGLGSLTCTDFSGTYPQFTLSASIPNRPVTCSGTWSGQVYVRRATETVLSTSSARLLWANTSGLIPGNSVVHPTQACVSTIKLQNGPYVEKSNLQYQTSKLVGSDTWYGDSKGVLSFTVADANTYPANYPGNDLPVVGRLNPMAAGTVITAAGTTGMTVTVAGGSPVANSSEATLAAISYEFTAASTGTVTVNVSSPSGLTTTYSIGVVNSASVVPSSCP